MLPIDMIWGLMISGLFHLCVTDIADVERIVMKGWNETLTIASQILLDSWVEMLSSYLDLKGYGAFSLYVTLFHHHTI